MHASHRAKGSSSAVRKTTRAKANSDLVQEPDADAPLQLDIFEQARRQIVEAKTVEQINHIIALATGLAAAARKATNRDLEVKAEVLKMEAKRKLGQLMAAQKETVGFNKGGRPKTGVSKTPVSEKLATLAEAGIDKNLVARAGPFSLRGRSRWASLLADTKPWARCTAKLARSEFWRWGTEAKRVLVDNLYLFCH